MRQSKKLIFISVFFFLTLITKSQTYPLPSPGAKWNVLQSMFGSCTIKYEYTKDTFMCGYNYAIISNQNQSVCSWQSPIFIRSVGSMIYGRAFSCVSPEFLLYDFGLNLNDTFIIATNFPDTAVVTNISYLPMLDGSIRKHMYLTSTSIIPKQYFWVEGIGDFSTLYYNHNLSDPAMDLLCFEDSLALIYKNTFWNTCDTTIIVGVSENNLPQNSFTVEPNHGVGTIRIKYSLEKKSRGYIFVHDITGRLLKLFSLKNNSGIISIAENDLTAGIFFCSLFANEKHILTKKIIRY